MQKKSIKRYILSKLFFPKVARIDTPGIIYNKVSHKITHRSSKKRIFMYFEDCLVALQKETIAAHGESFAKELWYAIGKESGMRYILLGGSQKKNPAFLEREIVDYLLDALKGGGFSAAEKYQYTGKNLILEGEDSIICRKGGICEYSAGFISGLLSGLLQCSMDGVCSCKKNEKDVKSVNPINQCCITIAEQTGLQSRAKKISQSSPFSLGISLSDYTRMNFPNRMPARKCSSFSELLQFKKATIDDSGKMYVLGASILPTEPGILEVIGAFYQRIGNLPLLKKIILQSSADITRRMGISSIGELENLLSALGFGIPQIITAKKECRVYLDCPPLCEFEPIVMTATVQGMLLAVLGRQLTLKDIVIRRESSHIKLMFTLDKGN